MNATYCAKYPNKKNARGTVYHPLISVYWNLFYSYMLLKPLNTWERGQLLKRSSSLPAHLTVIFILLLYKFLDSVLDIKMSYLNAEKKSRQNQ